LPPAHFRPTDALTHSVSVVHLFTHLFASQSTFAVSHLQRISYCWHALTEAELRYRHRISPFIGRPVARVAATLLRGTPPACGKLLTP